MYLTEKITRNSIWHSRGVNEEKGGVRMKQWSEVPETGHTFTVDQIEYADGVIFGTREEL